MSTIKSSVQSVEELIDKLQLLGMAPKKIRGQYTN
jgi:hypothetical protein